MAFSILVLALWQSLQSPHSNFEGTIKRSMNPGPTSPMGATWSTLTAGTRFLHFSHLGNPALSVHLFLTSRQAWDRCHTKRSAFLMVSFSRGPSPSVIGCFLFFAIFAFHGDRDREGSKILYTCSVGSRGRPRGRARPCNYLYKTHLLRLYNIPIPLPLLSF